MAVTETIKENLDLSSYDLEYCELLSVESRKEVNEIDLKLRCPVAGWVFKEKRNQFFRSLGLDALLSQTCVEYIVSLNFLGVTDVIESLISQGHAVIGRAPSDTTWMQSFIFEIEEIRIVKVKSGVFRFYLRSEGLQLDFNFTDCLAREKCVETK